MQNSLQIGESKSLPFPSFYTGVTSAVDNPWMRKIKPLMCSLQKLEKNKYIPTKNIKNE